MPRTEIQSDGSKIPIKSLKSFLELTRKQLTILQRYEDKAMISEVQDIQRTLRALLAAVQNDDTNKELQECKYCIHSLCSPTISYYDILQFFLRSYETP